jgi:hypothetical protein
MRWIVERLVVYAAVVAAPLVVVPGVASALPPDPPSAAMTRADLEQLVVRASSVEPYDREAQFGSHWTTHGGCSTRQRVLLRDGLNATRGPRCRITATHWRLLYDGVIVSSSGQVQIDHIVPLKNAWHSGAAAWTQAQRVAFANDLADPELIASTVHANESKGDEGPEEWLPRAAARCLYARWWVDVKSTWKLSVTGVEKRSLRRILNRC